MTTLVLAATVFVITHLLPAVGPLRAALVNGLGFRLYMTLYSLLSLAAIVWLGWAYADAPYLEVWPQTAPGRWVPALVMPVACWLWVAGLSSPNPFSLSLAAGDLDLARPGIVAVTRHPAVWAFVLWAAAHIVPNGDQASLVLFGLLTALSLAGIASLDHKRRAKMGAEEWERKAAAARRTARATALAQIGWKQWLGSAALYGLLFAVHEPLLGVAATP